MWLVVGLGNPGRKYAGNRHNVGFRVVDELARRHGITSFRDKFGSDVATGMFGLDKVILLKPMEYMNRSGFAVQRAADFYGLEAERIVVVHDDIDLDVGRLKLKRAGGHGGHNGLRSLVEQLGSRDFARVRCGIGKPGAVCRDTDAASAATAGERDRRVSGHVLSDFPAAEAETVAQMIERAADATESIVARGIEASMNDFNIREAPADSD